MVNKKIILTSFVILSKREKYFSTDHEAQFLHSMFRVSCDDIDKCYNQVARDFFDILRCKLIMVMTCNPSEDLLSIVSTHPTCNPDWIEEYAVHKDNIICGDVLDSLDIDCFDLENPEYSSRIQYTTLVEKLNLKKMISIPVFNPNNSNHVRFIINLFPWDDHFVLREEMKERLDRFSEYAALAVET